MIDKIFYHFKYLDNNMSFFLSSFLSLNTKVNLNDGKTVVVVAHSDDEVLWFEPLLANAKAIVFLGGSYGQTRYNFLTNIYGTNGVYNKNIPKYYAFDIITDQRWTDEALHDSCYRDNALYTYQNLYDHARPILEQLKSQGMKRVVTHNPWGEYGHPHHRRISDVIRDMAVNDPDVNFDVWYNDVAAIERVPVLTDSDYFYYTTWFLDNVTYTRSQYFNYNKYYQIKTDMQNTYITGVNPNNGQPLSADFWTWIDKKYDYPTGERKYWCAVDNGVDLIATNSTLATQISKIKGEIPYQTGEQYSEYLVLPSYSC